MTARPCESIDHKCGPACERGLVAQLADKFEDLLFEVCDEEVEDLLCDLAVKLSGRTDVDVCSRDCDTCAIYYEEELEAYRTRLVIGALRKMIADRE